MTDAESSLPSWRGLPSIFCGTVLLLLGYIASDIFVISDLYHISEFTPTPLSAALTTSSQQWGGYAIATAILVWGAVLIGSAPFNSQAMICYIMCPIAAAACLIGSPLRAAQKYARQVAFVYVSIGVCVAVSGIMQLLALYGQFDAGLSPITASVLAQVGIILSASGVLRLWRDDLATRSLPAAC